MVEIKHIRKIPNYILEKIKKRDNLEYPKPNKNTRFYKYFTTYNKELCEVTVAVRNKYKKWYCKQVIVHAIHNDKCFLQDIGRAMNYYKVGWYREKLTNWGHWYDYDWGWQYDNYFNLREPILNKEFITTLPQYKYSAIEQYEHFELLKYLRYYEQFPQAELLVKSGLSKLATNITILKKCAKDKKFCKWLYENKDSIKNNNYYTPSIIRAYNQNRDIKEMYEFDNFKRLFTRESNFSNLKEFLYDGELDTFLNYLVKQKTNGHSYNDYLTACQYLNIDMNEEKNRYPHDFKKWHDIRIDEYNSAKLEDDKKLRKEFYEKFGKVADKYISLQRNLKDAYCVIIAKSPADLIKEGAALNHCVGRMGYDQKFAREETLIFFIRNKETPNIPLVTLEYSIKNKKVLQCYGYKDSKPDDSILNFVSQVWLPYANRKIRKVA